MYKLNTGPLSSATAAYSNISFSVFFCEKFVRSHCIELLYIVSYIRLMMEEINGTTYFYYLGLYFFSTLFIILPSYDQCSGCDLI